MSEDDRPPSRRPRGSGARGRPGAAKQGTTGHGATKQGATKQGATGHGQRAGRGGGGSRARPEAGKAGSPDKPGLAARLAAARMLGAVIDARTPLDGLTDDAHGQPAYRALPPRDRGLVRAILLAALRHRGKLAAVIAHRLDRPLPSNARALEHHLHVGAAQVLLLDVPDHSAIDLAVEACRADPRARRFAGLANAILRRLARERARIDVWWAKQPHVLPEWLADDLESAYGAERAAAMTAMLAHEAALDLTPRTGPDALAEAMRAAGADPVTVLPTGTVRCGTAPGTVPELPGFTEGTWWVQDAAAALPARLLGARAGTRALDLCAAPGGKTAQLAATGARVTAVELNANRARRLRGNLDRLGLDATIVEGDLLKLDAEAVDGPHEAVLLDAPCSSTGTIRRHPDVAWTKTPEDVATLAALQSRLLEAAARHVAPGGRLVFANCSLLPVEGEAVADAFLAAHPDFVPEPVDWRELGTDEAALAPLVAEGRLRATPEMLPARSPRMAGLDGFFAARFRRTG